jgi:tetratricopeptide (TPR) repeat protein
MRYLLENTELADEVLGESLDGFLTEIHGDAVEAWALASRSYLQSGYFDEARGTLGEALARDPKRADLRHALAYADGMTAYLRGRYDHALRDLERWAADGPVTGEEPFRELALAAVTRLGPLAQGTGDERIGERVAALAQRLAPAKS